MEKEKLLTPSFLQEFLRALKLSFANFWYVSIWHLYYGFTYHNLHKDTIHNFHNIPMMYFLHIPDKDIIIRVILRQSIVQMNLIVKSLVLFYLTF